MKLKLKSAYTAICELVMLQIIETAHGVVENTDNKAATAKRSIIWIVWRNDWGDFLNEQDHENNSNTYQLVTLILNIVLGALTQLLSLVRF